MIRSRSLPPLTGTLRRPVSSGMSRPATGRTVAKSRPASPADRAPTDEHDQEDREHDSYELVAKTRALGAVVFSGFGASFDGGEAPATPLLRVRELQQRASHADSGGERPESAAAQALWFQTLARNQFVVVGGEQRSWSAFCRGSAGGPVDVSTVRAALELPESMPIRLTSADAYFTGRRERLGKEMRQLLSQVCFVHVGEGPSRKAYLLGRASDGCLAGLVAS